MLQVIAGAPDTVLVGIGVLVLGYLIKYRGWTFLIAGYDRSSDVPADAAGDLVGNFTLRVGVATIAFGAVTAAVPDSRLLGIGFAAIVLLGTARLLYRLNTYPSDDAGAPA